MTTRVRPWSVWWADFNPQVGHEQAGRRPAIVVGSATACSIPNGLVLVVPCTSRNRNLAWQPAVWLTDTPGVAMCDQMKSISVRRLVAEHPARLTEDEITAIRKVLRQLIDL